MAPPRTTSRAGTSRTTALKSAETTRSRKDAAGTSTRPKAAAKPTTKANKPSPDDLADKLASELRLEETYAALSPQDQAKEHMRTLDTISRELAVLVQKGGASGTTTSSVKEHAKVALDRLKALRTLKPRDLSVERVASSIIGKLVALDAIEEAVLVLHDMRRGLLAVCPPPPSPQESHEAFGPCPPFMHLPAEPPTDPVHVNLIACYLSYSLATLSSALFSPRHLASLPIDGNSDKEGASRDAALASQLQELLLAEGILEWSPHMTDKLPVPQLNALLKRAYTSLIQSSSEYSQTYPNTVFFLRCYGLLCLIETRGGTIKPDTLWDQATRFCVSLIQRTKSSGGKVLGHSLALMSKIMDRVELRGDAGDFKASKGFVTFCELWLDLARNTGLPADLKLAADKIRSSSGTSDGSPYTISRKSSDAVQTSSKLQRDGLAICTVLAQASSLVEDWLASTGDNPLLEGQTDVEAVLRRTVQFILLFENDQAGQGTSDDLVLLGGKVRRAVDTLRRALLKVVEQSAKTSGRLESRTVASKILVTITEVLEAAAARRIDPAFLSLVLDTIFVLSRVTLSPNKPDSHLASFDLLSRALALPGVELSSLVHGDSTAERDPIGSLEPMTKAEYARCISGAFHNLASSLYQAGKFASAARFLRLAALVGARALDFYRPIVAEGKVDSSKRDTWTQLAEQMYKRWELLGGCYMKTADRQLAYEAYIEAVKAFPVTESAFVSLTDSRVMKAVLDASSTHRQLGLIIDRATFLAVNDLLLPADQVPISRHLHSPGVNPHIPELAGTLFTGAVLERQLESLEASRWKTSARAAIQHVLAALLATYTPDRHPIRRSRILVKCLEYSYYTGVEGQEAGLVTSPDNALVSVQSLAPTKHDLARDTAIAHLYADYLASAHLWMVMHSHKCATPTDQVFKHAQKACEVLKSGIMGSHTLGDAENGSRRPASRAVRGTAKPRSTKGTTASKTNVKKVPKTAPVTPTQSDSKSDGSAVTKSSPVALSDPAELLELLDATSTLLGMMGFAPMKLRLLILAQRISERQLERSGDAYVRICVELAQEHVKMGKLKSAGSLYGMAMGQVQRGQVTEEVRVTFLLRHAETLALSDNLLEAVKTYVEAMQLAESISVDENGLSTAQRVAVKVALFERAAVAAHVFAVIQHCRDEPAVAIESLLQSLRLWNRAADTLTRLSRAMQPAEVKDPFAMDQIKDALPASNSDVPRPERRSVPEAFRSGSVMGGTEWRISQGMVTTLLALSKAHFSRGSPRETEYFALQAQDLAKSVSLDFLVGQALLRRGELQLSLGKLDTAGTLLVEAIDSIGETATLELVDAYRLLGVYDSLNQEEDSAGERYASAVATLAQLQTDLSSSELTQVSSEKLSSSDEDEREELAPVLLASVLRRHAWLLRSEAGEQYEELVQQLAGLPVSTDIQSELHAVVAMLTLDEAYGRFASDMFLSSIAESTIALPMGMINSSPLPLTAPAQEVVGILSNAEQLFWSDLQLLARRGTVSHVRAAAVSLAMIGALRSSFGNASPQAPLLAARLIDSSTSLAASREMLEAIQLKLPDLSDADDLRWPLMTSSGEPLAAPPSARQKKRMKAQPRNDSDEEDEDVDLEDANLKTYWTGVRQRHAAFSLDEQTLLSDQAKHLPEHWVVVHISVSEDKNTMFISRQRAHHQPLVFCLPLKGRREGDDDEEQLGFEDVVAELEEIIRLSDESTRNGQSVPNHRDARAAWWAERAALDKRMMELVGNIEFCWLGAFKAILNPPSNTSPEDIADLRTRIENIFHRTLRIRDKKFKVNIKLDIALVECFSTLSPKSRDEEFEDIVYFILDLYQAHGVPVILSEVDVDQVAVELRTAMEEHAARVAAAAASQDDVHMFLVLDKNLQGLPWESIPVLRGRSVSRIPNMAFLLDRLDLANLGSSDASSAGTDRIAVDPRKATVILNPSGDLKRTEARFKPWLQDMKKVGWSSIVGRAPSEQEFVDALARKDLVIYFGHGGGEQYARSHKIRRLQQCAATMLFGCSSGFLKDMGEFDRVGTPYHYMLAGCPTLVANLWDVTDGDVDKFSQAVFDKLSLTPDNVRSWGKRRRGGTSLVTAVAQSREVCKLKYLTGAAPVVYGIPFYL